MWIHSSRLYLEHNLLCVNQYTNPFQPKVALVHLPNKLNLKYDQTIAALTCFMTIAEP